MKPRATLCGALFSTLTLLALAIPATAQTPTQVQHMHCTHILNNPHAKPTPSFKLFCETLHSPAAKRKPGNTPRVSRH